MKSTHAALNLEPLTVTPELLVLKIIQDVPYHRHPGD